MKDQSKTKTQLIEELETLRKQVAKLKRMETKRKPAEEALRESEEKFRMVADFTYDWEYWLKADGNFVYVSPSCERITGYRVDEFFDNPNLLTSIVHPDDYGLVSRHISEALKPGSGICRIDFRIITRGGEERWINHYCQPVFNNDGIWLGRRGSNRDITERKKAEEALQLSEYQYHTTIDSMGDAMHVVDNKLQLILVNKTFKKWLKELGLETEIIGKTIYEAFPFLRDEVREQYRSVFESGQLFTSEEQNIVGDQKIFTETRKIPVFEEGKVVRVVSVIRDITERKQVEEKIHSYQEQLRSLASELSLLEERERRQIATDLHDYIGQNLAITKMRLGALRELAISGDLSTLVEEIQTLTDQAIQYTRSLTSELSPPVLYELGFETAVEWLTGQIQGQHHIQVDFEDDRRPKPMSDEIRVTLFKAVKELLINIAKHSKARQAKVSTQREDNIVRIIVQDDGVGFSIPEDKSFTQIGGFGLFSLRERLRHLGGNFEMESKSGQGTRITLVAPLTKEENNNRSVT